MIKELSRNAGNEEIDTNVRQVRKIMLTVQINLVREE